MAVAASYTALWQRGAEFLGRCPLCGCDPSLAVKPAAGTVRCSGCGARHDAIGLIQAVEKVDATRAKRRLRSRIWKPLAPIVYEARPVAPRRKPARKKRLTVTCGAKNRRGEPCQCKRLGRGGRCRLHGGLSLTNADRARITQETGRAFTAPGPKTPEGKARSLRNVRPFRDLERVASSEQRTGEGSAGTAASCRPDAGHRAGARAHGST